VTGFEFIAVFFVATVVGLIVSFAVANAAQRKGRSWAAFFWLSFLVNWLIMAIIVAVIAPLESSSSKGRRPCPRCAEPISVQASLCKHCGTEVEPMPLPQLNQPTLQSRGLFVAGIATSCLGFFWIVIYYLSAAKYPFGAATALDLQNWNILLGLLMLAGGVVSMAISTEKTSAKK